MKEICILCKRKKEGKYIYAGTCQYVFVCNTCLSEILGDYKLQK